MAPLLSATLQVLGIGSDGTEPSVVLSIHRHGVYSADTTVLQQYLFNCGEGTQRGCGENGVKLSAMRAIYLTRLDVTTSSGITGMLFTLSLQGAEKLRVHGPNGTTECLAAMQTVVRRKFPLVECVEVEEHSGSTCDCDGEDGGYSKEWRSGTCQEDEYMRICAVYVGSTTATTSDQEDRCGCALCHHSATKSADIAQSDCSEVRTIANLGSEDRSDSSSSSESDDDDQAEELDADAPIDLQWLEAFYKKHEPGKLQHASRILRQFAGREEQLRSMLLGKYGVKRASCDSTISEPPDSKRARIEEDQAETTGEKIEIPTTWVLPSESLAKSDDASSPCPAAICYILQ